MTTIQRILHIRKLEALARGMKKRLYLSKSPILAAELRGLEIAIMVYRTKVER